MLLRGHGVEEGVTLLLLLMLLGLMRVMRTLRVEHLNLLDVRVPTVHVLVYGNTVHVLRLSLLVSRCGSLIGGSWLFLLAAEIGDVALLHVTLVKVLLGEVVGVSVVNLPLSV